jgi:DNA polymerase-3 subunit delta'
VKLPWLDNPWRRYLQRLNQGRLAHALLLAGPSGLGKEWLAGRMAAMLLCLEPGPEGACGKCRSCQLLVGGAHPDRFLLAPEEGKNQIRVDQVRAFSASLNLTTTISPRKVAVLCPAELMNVNAANALLKSLEEPQGDTVIILVSHDPGRLPVTIRSRCQAIPVAPPRQAESLEWVQAQAAVDAEQGNLAMVAANGSPLRAVALLESGAVEEFSRLQQSLAGLLGQPTTVSSAAHGLAELDPEQLWTWLSMSAASALRGSLQGQAAQWLKGRDFADRKRLAELQQSADRNRRLAGTPVRQDLLLQEWLLEWARQPGNVTRQGRVNR